MSDGDADLSWSRRGEREVPGANSSPPKPPLSVQNTPRLRVVAPVTSKEFNLIKLTTWFELRLVSARGKPLVDEKCQLFDPSGKIIEKKTDKDGVVRFDGLPLLPPANTDWRDTSHPAVVFPDILEEWSAPQKASSARTAAPGTTIVSTMAWCISCRPWRYARW